MNTFVVGDIHGCAELLRDLLRQIECRLDSDDRIVFLGDYIDRGPDSRGVIDQVLALRHRHDERVVCLTGNHEQWFIEAYHNPTCVSWLLGMGGLKTIRSYSHEAAAAIEESLGLIEAQRVAGHTGKIPLPYDLFFQAVPPEHVDFFLHELKLHYEDENVLCVHAGVDPDRPLDEQFTADLLWGDPLPLLSDWPGPKTLVVGHKQTQRIDPSLWGKPLIKDHMVCLDTGPNTTGLLSAMRFPDRLLLQAGTSERRPPA